MAGKALNLEVQGLKAKTEKRGQNIHCIAFAHVVQCIEISRNEPMPHLLVGTVLWVSRDGGG